MVMIFQFLYISIRPPTSDRIVAGSKRATARPSLRRTFDGSRVVKYENAVPPIIMLQRESDRAYCQREKGSRDENDVHLFPVSVKRTYLAFGCTHSNGCSCGFFLVKAINVNWA